MVCSSRVCLRRSLSSGHPSVGGSDGHARRTVGRAYARSRRGTDVASLTQLPPVIRMSAPVVYDASSESR
ncbi:PHP-associated domain-containing protein [Luteimicrobium subarcticum]|uniref:PHP-associated domain-containing protein n=1 Tax=Luteimicrobium subarcticum TaxID=620910 RepID=UPI0012FD3AEA